MSKKRFWILTGILILLVVFIRTYSGSSIRVEENYSTGIYPKFGAVLRFLFGWIPFSIGDFLYGAFGIWILWQIIKSLKAIFKRKLTGDGSLRRLQKTVILALSLYVVFNLFWGINYNRKGISSQLSIKLDTIGFNDLKEISFLLADKLNSTKSYLIKNTIPYPNNKELFNKVEAAYSRAKDSLSFLEYSNPSIKSSLWGWLGNYTGFTGYYNPFTGEAQVNTTAPKFLQPFVTCHEVAHQLGYAKENEANSVGYLAALYSGDSLLLYSTYFDLYNYAAREFALQSFIKKDTVAFHELKAQLIPAVKADIKEMYDFFRRHKNPVEPFIRNGYSLYLKNNNQPGGMRSYDEVLGFIIAYYKKFGRI